MRANNRVIFIESYLNGFNEVYRHDSMSTILLGFLKIISYALILPPLILGYQYLKTKKIVALQNGLDEKIDNRVQALFENVIPHNDRQVKLREYLINKLVNFEPNDDAEREKLRFERAFKLLDFDSQKEFFKRAIKENCMALCLAWIPKDIQEINFITGPQNPIQHSSINNHHLRLLLDQLPTWNNLRKIHLNLKGAGFFGPSADTNIQTMTLTKCFHASEDPRRHFNIGGITYNFSNDPFYLLKAIQALKVLIQHNPNLEWNIRFMDFGISGEGVDLRVHLEKYLTQPI